MMMECPKCGFVQPRDQYCANCGVDVENYKPQQPGFWSRMINSTYLQMGLIVIAIASLVFVLLVSQRRTTQLDVSNEAQIIDPANVAAAPAPTAAPPVKQKREEPAATPTGARALVPQASVDTAASEKRAKTGAGWSIQLKFVEIPMEVLGQISSEGQTLREENGVKSILYKWDKKLEDLKSKDPKWTWLPGDKTFQAKITEGVDAGFRVNADTGAEYGLMLRLVPTSISNTTVQIEIEGQLLLPGENSTHINIDLFGSYTLPNDTIVVIAGGIPHRKVQDDLARLFSKSPLTILNSRDFIENRSDFAILIQARNSSSK